jgi:hypothetical protein
MTSHLADQSSCLARQLLAGEQMRVACDGSGRRDVKDRVGFVGNEEHGMDEMGAKGVLDGGGGGRGGEGGGGVCFARPTNGTPLKAMEGAWPWGWQEQSRR